MVLTPGFITSQGSLQSSAAAAAAYLDVAVDDVHAVQVLDAASHLQQHLQQQSGRSSSSTRFGTIHSFNTY